MCPTGSLYPSLPSTYSVKPCAISLGVRYNRVYTTGYTTCLIAKRSGAGLPWYLAKKCAEERCSGGHESTDPGPGRCTRFVCAGVVCVVCVCTCVRVHNSDAIFSFSFFFFSISRISAAQRFPFVASSYLRNEVFLFSRCYIESGEKNGKKNRKKREFRTLRGESR